MFEVLKHDPVFYILLYTFGGYLVSLIGSQSDKINKKTNPNHVISTQTITALYIAVFLSWITIGFFIWMVIRSAFTPETK